MYWCAEHWTQLGSNGPLIGSLRVRKSVRHVYLYIIAFVYIQVKFKNFVSIQTHWIVKIVFLHLFKHKNLTNILNNVSSWIENFKEKIIGE